MKYEIVGYDSQKMPSSGSTETLSEAEKLRDEFFATGRYDLVLIRQYKKDRFGRERYCVLHSLSKKAVA